MSIANDQEQSQCSTIMAVIYCLRGCDDFHEKEEYLNTLDEESRIGYLHVAARYLDPHNNSFPSPYDAVEFPKGMQRSKEELIEAVNQHPGSYEGTALMLTVVDGLTIEEKHSAISTIRDIVRDQCSDQSINEVEDIVYGNYDIGIDKSELDALDPQGSDKRCFKMPAWSRVGKDLLEDVMPSVGWCDVYPKGTELAALLLHPLSNGEVVGVLRDASGNIVKDEAIVSDAIKHLAKIFVIKCTLDENGNKRCEPCFYQNGVTVLGFLNREESTFGAFDCLRSITALRTGSDTRPLWDRRGDLMFTQGKHFMDNDFMLVEDPEEIPLIKREYIDQGHDVLVRDEAATFASMFEQTDKVVLAQ